MKEATASRFYRNGLIKTLIIACRSIRGGGYTGEDNWMFRGLLEYLSGLSKLSIATCDNQPLPRVELVKLLTDVSGFIREKSRSTQYINYCYRLSRECKPIVLEIRSADNIDVESK